MSVEEAVTDGLQQPADPNAQSAEDVKNLLAELKGEQWQVMNQKEPSEATEKKQEKPETSEAETKPEDAANEDETKTEEKKDDDQRHDRQERRDGHSGRGRGRGRGGRGGQQGRNYKDNIKSDLTTGQVTDDPHQIRKQVEFYFSDSNLPMDKFLLEKTGGSENNAVPIETLHSFKRMRRFQPLSAVVDALKESDFLEVVNDDTAVRRRNPLTENLDSADVFKTFEDAAMPRTVYVKGFGEEVPSTQFDIEAFFSEYGPTNAIRLRRNAEKHFKSSVFVEFESEELQKTFLALDPKPQWKGKDLKIMSKKEYCDTKVEDIKAGKIQPKGYDRDRRNPNYSDRHSGDHKRKRSDEEGRDWRDRRADDQKRGFKDDRRGDRRGGRGGRGGRGDRRGDDRGDRYCTKTLALWRCANAVPRSIPKVRDTSGEHEGKRDDARATALARAKAMVDAEKKKEAEADAAAAASEQQNGHTEDKTAAVKSEATEQKEAPAVTDAASKTAESVTVDVEAATSKKRAREDDEVENEREAKKVVKEEDVKGGDA